MVYLKAWLHVLEQQASKNDGVTLLDHGPIYLLALLREFGPEITTSELFKSWWANLYHQWSATIDILIWLDAPDEILLERIRVRDRWHLIKDKSEQEAYEFLTRYRTSLEQIIAESVTNHRVTLLRFDTSEESVEQMADKILAAFDFVPHNVHQL